MEACCSRSMASSLFNSRSCLRRSSFCRFCSSSIRFCSRRSCRFSLFSASIIAFVHLEDVVSCFSMDSCRCALAANCTDVCLFFCDALTLCGSGSLLHLLFTGSLNSFGTAFWRVVRDVHLAGSFSRFVFCDLFLTCLFRSRSVLFLRRFGVRFSCSTAACFSGLFLQSGTVLSYAFFLVLSFTASCTLSSRSRLSSS